MKLNTVLVIALIAAVNSLAKELPNKTEIARNPNPLSGVSRKKVEAFLSELEEKGHFLNNVTLEEEINWTNLSTAAKKDLELGVPLTYQLASFLFEKGDAARPFTRQPTDALTLLIFEMVGTSGNITQNTEHVLIRNISDPDAKQFYRELAAHVTTLLIATDRNPQAVKPSDFWDLRSYQGILAANVFVKDALYVELTGPNNNNTFEKEIPDQSEQIANPGARHFFAEFTKMVSAIVEKTEEWRNSSREAIEDMAGGPLVFNRLRSIYAELPSPRLQELLNEINNVPISWISKKNLTHNVQTDEVMPFFEHMTKYAANLKAVVTEFKSLDLAGKAAIAKAFPITYINLHEFAYY